MTVGGTWLKGFWIAAQDNRPPIILTTQLLRESFDKAVAAQVQEQSRLRMQYYIVGLLTGALTTGVMAGVLFYLTYGLI